MPCEEMTAGFECMSYAKKWSESPYYLLRAI